jgi:hypothetical protein
MPSGRRRRAPITSSNPRRELPTWYAVGERLFRRGALDAWALPARTLKLTGMIVFIEQTRDLAEGFARQRLMLGNDCEGV